ncbi:MAG: MarR family transcriptional regulator [Pseudomonadota bacterium]
MPDGLKLPHFIVLNHLVRLGDGARPVDLARAFQVTKGTITHTLGRLLTPGFIRLEDDAMDRRVKRVYLTEAGRQQHERCIAALVPAFQPMKQALDPADFAAALPFLQALRGYLDQAREETWRHDRSG